MNIKCNRTDLLASLRNAQGLAAKKSGTLDILNHCLVVYSPSSIGGNPSLNVTATNLEMFNRSRFTVEDVDTAEPETNNAITLPTGLVYDVLSNMVDTEIRIRNDDNKTIHILGESAEYQFLGLPSEDYPVIPIDVETGMFDIESEILIKALRSAVIAAGEPTRPILNAVLFEVDSQNHQLRLVATDTRRLAYKCVMIEEQAFEDDWTANMSKRCVLELLKMLPDSLELVSVSRSDSMITFKWGECSLSANLVNGQYPDYKKIIPDSSRKDATLMFDTRSIQMALKRISVMAKEDSYKACFHVDTENEKILVHGESARLGVGDECIELLQPNILVDPDSGEAPPADYVIKEADFKLNSRHLTDVLNIIHDDMVVVETTGESGPIIIKGLDDPSFLYLISPIRE